LKQLNKKKGENKNMKLKDLLLIIQTNQYISINIREKENSLNIKKN